MLKWLSLIDEHTRECLTLKVDRGLTSEDVINTLAELFQTRGVPRCIRSDNGPEFISKTIRAWLDRLGIEVLHIAPGSPWENGDVERFHSKFRDEFLNRELFENFQSAQQLTSNWRTDDNHHRPHSSLNDQTPTEFAARWAPTKPHNPNSHNPWYRKWGQAMLADWNVTKDGLRESVLTLTPPFVGITSD